MILIGISLVALIYIVAILALRKAPFPDDGVLGSTPKSVRAGKLPAGSVKLSEPATCSSCGDIPVSGTDLCSRCLHEWSKNEPK